MAYVELNYVEMVDYYGECPHKWKYLYDRDNGDWSEEVYVCEICNSRDYRELPD